jgi:polysaccharide export outer membrane protein
MNALKLSLLLAVLAVVSGCSTKLGPRFDPLAAGAAGGPSDGAFAALDTTNKINPDWLKPPTEPLKLGPGDVIDVEIVGEAASRSTMLVGPDGKIYYSILPGLSVWGLSLAETKALLEREASKLTRLKPELSVNLKTFSSQRVWILGSVEKPAVYNLAGPATLLEAISTVGGIVTTPGAASVSSADLQNSFVLRDGRMLPVDFDRLFERGDLSQNIYLRPDDFVYVRPANNPTIYVLGAVTSPNILPHTTGLSVAAAVSLAGGTLPLSHNKQVLVVRGGLTHPKVATVDYADIIKGQTRDVALQPGDIVYVPYVPYYKAAQMVDLILNTFVSVIAGNTGLGVGGTKQSVGVSISGGK